MPKPVVSVIIPAHDRPALLRLALDSLARQTFRNFETIVVDDGSAAELAPLCADHPIAPRVVRQDQSGPAAARNLGISLARADLVAFLDSDDEWLPGKLEQFLAARDADPDVEIWYGPMRPIDRAGKPVVGRTKPCFGGRITRELFESSFVHVPTVLCARECILEFGGFNPALPVCEDYDLWLRMSVRQRFGLVPEPLALRRLHGERLSKSHMRRNLVVKAQVLEHFHRESASRALLDPLAARRRIGRVLMAAARAALRDRCTDEAIALAQRAATYGETRMSVWGVDVAARAVNWLGLERRMSAEAQAGSGSADPIAPAASAVAFRAEP